MLELWRNALGTVPAGFEVIEYTFCSVAVILVVILIFRFIITLIKILSGKEK